MTSFTTVASILTRSSGFLRDVCSHSLQPYQGCPFGRALCGVGCYVRHNPWITRGRPWGSFLEARTNAADAYRSAYHRERAWARRHRSQFAIFLSSSTEPFPPQETRLGLTRSVLQAMRALPPDLLILQTHSPGVVQAEELLVDLSRSCQVRVHISIETDRDRLPGLPPPAASVEERLAAAARLKRAGLFTVITVAPLLPIADPHRFFARVAASADAVVLDHFIAGDGSPNGRRTRSTPLPAAMAAIDPASLDLSYRDRMGVIAEGYLPGRVGYHTDGFAARWGRP
ncbi:MAG: hypothetical protein KatS3mg108_2080 [Isosphaeraceae bacterium]|jgi:DNA repair photolyase|nr:MAG: hypothetical protein KatS3mg108_2080 [Isosphaeraceae bacterium]